MSLAAKHHPHPERTILAPVPDLPQKGPTDRMADYLLDRLPRTVRFVFVLKIAINLVVGLECLFTSDVQPAWACGGLFIVAGLMNVYVAAVLRPTRVASYALALSIGGCLFRAGALLMARLDGSITTTIPHVLLGMTVWFALAAFGATATMAASSQLGTGRVRRR